MRLTPILLVLALSGCAALEPADDWQVPGTWVAAHEPAKEYFWETLPSDVVRERCGFRFVHRVMACVVRDWPAPDYKLRVRILSNVTERQAATLRGTMPTGGAILDCNGNPETLLSHEWECHVARGLRHKTWGEVKHGK